MLWKNIWIQKNIFNLIERVTDSEKTLKIPSVTINLDENNFGFCLANRTCLMTQINKTQAATEK